MISSNDAENIGIVGPGKIVGSPAVRGRVNRETKMRLPALLEFVNCRNVRVENCYTENFGMWSIHPTYCEDVSFRNVTVKSGADGIDVDSCRNVTIDGCDFDTTDDCISLKSGRGAEGYTILRPTEDVRISNCSFRDKVFACIGIGSETSGGIRNVHVDSCKCLSAGTYAIYIKSRPGRGAFIENIYMNNLEVSGAKQGFLRFNILNSGIADEYLVPGDEGIPTIRNFEFRNIKVTDEPVLVDGTAIHPHKPLNGFVLENVTGTCGKGISLANVTDARIANVNVTGFQGPLLSIHNVTGKGLQGAVQIEGPKVPDPIQPAAEPYKLH
jgi:polygalacturonase